MLIIRELPDIHFVDKNAFARLELRTCGPVIGRLALRLRSRFPEARRLGLIFRSEPTLVLTWLAALHAGIEPLILEVPNEKQSIPAWRASIAKTVELAALDGLVLAPEFVFRQPPHSASLVLDADDAKGDDVVAPCEEVTIGAVLQLSSGTTGHRKAIRFPLAQVWSHIENYNRVIRISSGDCIVSWLPLYHDMGFVACFLTALALRIPIVLIDPITWVRCPALLFDAIERYSGTICYMPNFGFNVMSREPAGRRLGSMRYWISCSEPVYAETMARFAQAHKIPSDKVAVCYAMAENVFAVTFRPELRVVDTPQGPRISCGRPIPGVSLRLRDGEICVKSPTALQAYEGGIDVRDADGFFPTGDMGVLIHGELVVTGRKGDLINIAGRKFFLNDIDQAVNSALPDARGRAAALAYHDAHIGSERIIILVERSTFYDDADRLAAINQINERLGMDGYEFHFVPERFLSKTSSGKINRSKTLEDWLTAREWRRLAAANGPGVSSLREAIEEQFPAVPKDVPIAGLLDSLSLTTLRVLMEERGLEPDFDAGLEAMCVQDDARSRFEGDGIEIVTIVALTEGSIVETITDADLGALSSRIGCKVVLEHVCAPPSPVLLSDLIFHDYFMAREWPEQKDAYAALHAILMKVKRAALILVDDNIEFYRSRSFHHVVLDHQFHRDARSGQMAWRYQRYTSQHHRLPIRVVHPSELPHPNVALSRLQAYLGVPVVRMAFGPNFRGETADWEFRPLNQPLPHTGPWTYDRTVLLDLIAQSLEKQGERVARQYVPQLPKNIALDNMAHFCADLMDREKLSSIIDRHQRFCLVGPVSSVVFLEEEIKRRGKICFRCLHDWGLMPPDTPGQEYDCIVQVGCWGKPAIDVPIYQVFWSGWRPEGKELEWQPHRLWFYKGVGGADQQEKIDDC